MYECPKCKSNNMMIERCPLGKIQCKECGHVLRERGSNIMVPVIKPNKCVIAIVDTFFQPPIDSPAEQNTYTKSFDGGVDVYEIIDWADSKGENIKSIRILKDE